MDPIQEIHMLLLKSCMVWRAQVQLLITFGWHNDRLEYLGSQCQLDPDVLMQLAMIWNGTN